MHTSISDIPMLPVRLLVYTYLRTMANTGIRRIHRAQTLFREMSYTGTYMLERTMGYTSRAIVALHGTKPVKGWPIRSLLHFMSQTATSLQAREVMVSGAARFPISELVLLCKRLQLPNLKYKSIRIPFPKPPPSHSPRNRAA